jgi:hypothetical protein
LTGIPLESRRSFYLDFKIWILQEMRQQGVEEAVRDLLHKSFGKALSNLDALAMPPSGERERLRKIVEYELLEGMTADD